jgi:hypothetical protein
MRKADPIVVIDYKKLGTIALDELTQAIWEDVQMLREEFGVSFITGVKLVVPATNQYGDPLQVRRLSTGAPVRLLDTHHYHPACLDYKL